MTAPRLTDLAQVKGTAALPCYRPSDHGAGIVHLGNDGRRIDTAGR